MRQRRLTRQELALKTMLQMRKNLPPLDYLVAFEAAARLGGFARAAEHLHISESSISRKIRLLEQHYNLMLFERKHRSVKLTKDGEAFLPAVTKAFDILGSTSDDLLLRDEGGTVTVAATNSVAALWLTPRLANFHAQNSGVLIALTGSDSDEECLAEGVDFSILRGDGDWPGFTSELLFGETIFPVCSPSYLERFPDCSTAEELPSQNLIEVSSHHSEWMNWKNWLTKRGFEDPVVERSAVFNTYPLAVHAAIDGLGLVLGWGHLIDRYLESGQLVRPVENHAVRTSSGYYLLYRDQQQSLPARSIVIDWLRHESALRQRYGS